jgi:hypothetical protein
MRFPWREHENGTVEQHPAEQATEHRSAADWRNEISQLKAELVRIGEERTQLTDAAGAALLAGQRAVVADAQARLAALSTSEQIIGAAITEAEVHQRRAVGREDRQAALELEAGYYLLLSRYCESRARVRDAEENLARVTAEQRGAVDRAQLGSLYQAVLAAGRAPEGIEDPTGPRRNAASYRADAERYRRRAGIAPAEQVAEGVPT